MLTAYRPITITVAAGLLLKLALWFWALIAYGLTPADMMAAHDGHEYLTYAEIITTGATGPLPEDVIRHDPGLPLLIAAVGLISAKLLSPAICGLLVQLAAWITGVVLTAKLCARWSGERICRPAVLVVAAIGYPATLYYGQFNLTEPPFLVMVLGSVLAAADRKYVLAFALAGFSSLVRSTGLLLVISLLLTHPATVRLLREPRGAIQLIAYAAVGIAPWVITQSIFHRVFNADFAAHEPRFGWPFSGFRGLADAGAVRSTYIIMAVGFFVVSTVLAVNAAISTRCTSQVKNLAAVFMMVFLTFHLCLKSLYYIDRHVWTFDYQDRYLVPLWPLAVLAWQRWISMPIAVVLPAISFAMTVYWTGNYTVAAGAVKAVVQAIGATFPLIH